MLKCQQIRMSIRNMHILNTTILLIIPILLVIIVFVFFCNWCTWPHPCMVTCCWDLEFKRKLTLPLEQWAITNRTRMWAQVAHNHLGSVQGACCVKIMQNVLIYWHLSTLCICLDKIISLYVFTVLITVVVTWVLFRFLNANNM